MREHGLAMHNKRSKKVLHQNMLSDVNKCSKQINLSCEDKMLYCIKNLHSIAHGGHDINGKFKQDEILKTKHQLNIIDIPTTLRSYIDPFGISIFRSGSDPLIEIAKCVKGTLHQDIFHRIMNTTKNILWKEPGDWIIAFILDSIVLRVLVFY
jgi:hypothetical protein